MYRAVRTLAMCGIVATAGLVIHADPTPPSQAAEIQLQLANVLLDEGRLRESLDAFQYALGSASDRRQTRLARRGVINVGLRLTEFELARKEAEQFVGEEPESADALALFGDALWASGLFQQAEDQYRAALKLEPRLSRGHHGLARSLLAKSKVDEAMNEAQEALRLDPRDLEIHHTVGMIYERMQRYDAAAGAYTNYVNLLPNQDRSDKALWARSEIRFLQSFGQRVPFEADQQGLEALHTVDFKVVNDKVIVRARVNDAPPQDFVVDTGSESTVISRFTARRLGITPVTHTLSAGVGEVGLRGLQLARIDTLELGTLKIRNVPAIIKNPPLRDIPVREAESLSPLALGYSMIIDYKTRKLTFGKRLPVEEADLELPLRLYRLATVIGTVDGKHQANFVVDTGGEVISISQATATALGKTDFGRKIALKVWGTSGWDRDAFLMPGVNLAFESILYNNFPVVVLNLRVPSALLGFQLGGTVGHRFLSKYRAGIDLDRSVLRLKAIS